MRLNVQSDYALRLLMHLAVRDGELLTIYYGEDEDDVTVIFGTKWRI